MLPPNGSLIVTFPDPTGTLQRTVVGADISEPRLSESIVLGAAGTLTLSIPRDEVRNDQFTAASIVVHMDRWWNPAVENQATDRAFRIGQRRNVQVYKMITAGTLEESIQDILDGKTQLAGAVVGEGEGWLTELEPDQLAELMSYRGKE